MIKNFVSRFWVLILIITGPLGLFSANSGSASEEPLSFVQITDIHVAGSDTVQPFTEDIKEINSLAGKIGFVIATGDLVENGNNETAYENYKKAVLEFRFPLRNAIGNHDAPIENYRKFLGPDYYSFDLAQKHFVVLDCLNPSLDPSRYAEWLKKDLESQPKEKDIIVFQHYHPDKTLLDLLSQYNTRALFYGHWHSKKAFRYGKILIVSTPPLRFGGIDCAPRGFRVIAFNKKEGVTTEYRWSGINRHLSIISPAGTTAGTNNNTVSVKVAAYDTSSKIKSVLYRLDGGRWNPAVHTGGWLWQADKKVKQVPGGEHTIKVRVVPDSGAFWEKEEKFSLAGNQPFLLVWNQYAGGETGMSAPVVEKNRRYIGVQDDDNAQNGGVICFDAFSGKPVWKFKTGCSINGTPAVTEGIVCVVSVVGTVYAVDAAGGKELWRYSLGNPWERWVYNSPVVSGGTVYCGVAPYFVALDLKTGEKLWQAQSMGNDWISGRTSPAVDDKNVYVGSNWGNGLFALNRQTGAVVWNKKEGFGTTHSSPVVCGGTVYYAADNKLYALEKETGKELWRAELAGGWTVSSPAVKDSTLVVGSPDGKILAFDAQTGQRLWSYQTKTAIGSFSAYQRGGTQVMASPSIAGDKVYIGSNDGNLYILDLKTGEKLWSHDLGAPILSAAAVSGNNVYVTTYDGNIYAFVQGKP